MSVNEKIKKLKLFLMSRNFHHQNTAIITILKLLKNKNSIITPEVMINTDIPGLLCDVMNNHNLPLIQGVFSCLLNLSRYDLFYSQKHSHIAIETTCRTLKILSNDFANMKMMYFGLKILNDILSRCQEVKSLNIGQILQLVKDLLFNTIFQKLHLNVMCLLKYILSNTKFTYKDLLPTVHQALSIISKLNQNNNNKLNKNITLASDIMLFSLRLCPSGEDNPLWNKVLQLIISLIHACIIPFIQEMGKKCHTGLITRQLIFLADVFKFLDYKTRLELSDNLASKGFLTLLLFISLHFKDKSLHSCVLVLLSCILCDLAHSELGTSDNENQLIANGLHYLPADFSDWPKFLDQTKAEKTHLAIFVYLYFVFLSAKSFGEFPTFLPALCRYLKSQNCLPSTALLKAIWFVYAVLSLSKSCGNGRKGTTNQEEAANGVLVSWLQRVPLVKVFTHHPALLLWTFTPHVSKKLLQINVMSLWLKEKGESSLMEIEQLVLSNKNAAICLLDVLSSCSMDIIPQIVSVLKALLRQGMTKRLQEMGFYIWEKLPQTLSTVITPYSKAAVNNICCMVYLACRTMPAMVNIVSLIRISHQLLQVIHHQARDITHTEDLCSQLFKLAHRIIILMNNAKDYRVLCQFLQDINLIRTLLVSLNSKKDTVVLSALQLLLFLQYCQKKYNIRVTNSLCLSADTLVQLMSCSRSETLFTSVQFFTNLHTTNNMKPLIALPTDTANHVVQSLYLNFQMLTTSEKKDSWRCQTLLLEFCRTHNSEMHRHLLIQSWTYTVIRLALKQNGITNMHVLEFLKVWLEGVKQGNFLPRVNYARAICQDSLSKTLTDIAMTVLQQDDCNDALNSDHYAILFKISTTNANIPMNVVMSMQRRLRDTHFFKNPTDLSSYQ